MITKDEAWNLIADLNDEAHAETWDQWEAADGDDEEGGAHLTHAERPLRHW